MNLRSQTYHSSLIKLEDLSSRDREIILRINSFFKLKTTNKGEIMLFDVTNVEVKNNYEPIPKGKYNVISDNVEVKETKSGAGKYISVTFKITHGEYEGRLLFSIFNIQNPSAQAVEIGMQELKKWLMASGLSEDKMKVKDVNALFGLTCAALVDVKTTDDGSRNVIKGYTSLLDSLDATLGAPTKTVAKTTGSRVPGL